MKHKAGIICVAVATSLALSAVAAVTAVGVKQCVIRTPKPAVNYESLSEKYKIRYKLRQQNNAYLFSKNPEDLSLTDKFGNELKAWFVEGRDKKHFVICVHGYKNNGPDECSHLFPFYNDELGFNYLLPDHAAHGRSTGEHIGFGAYEAENLLMWVDYLINRFGEDIEIVLHGISMGAATVMLANESNPPSQVKAVVEDCGYTSAFEIIDKTIEDRIGFSCPPITRLINLVCKVGFGYDMETADPLGRMEQAKAPILFVHGDKDTLVPFSMAERLYEACDAVEKDKLFVEGAVHAFCYYDAQQEYNDKMREFFSKYLTDFSLV